MKAARPALLFLLLGLASPAAGQEAPGRAFLAQAQAQAASLPALPACVPARADADGRIRQHGLPARILGAAEGTTGGLGRRLLLVESTSDDTAPGTLRWAIAAAAGEGGGWIAFAPALSGQTIQLRRGLRLPADTTLDGGCGGILLLAAARDTTLLIADVTNVIVSGLRFTKQPYSEPAERTGDAIGMQGGFDRIAIMNNAFSRCGDGCIDVVRRELSPALARVTIAFNRIEDHNKVMLAGVLACTAQRQDAACDQPLEALGGTLRPTIRISLVGNVFLRTSQRHPKAVAGAFVHSVNNLMALAPTTYSDGQESAVYGGAAASGGLIASEGDILVNLTGPQRLGIGPVSATRPAGATAREADGAVAAAGTNAIGAVRVVPHRAELALAQLAPEPRPATALPATRDPAALAACLLAGAGPAGAAAAWPRPCSAASGQRAGVASPEPRPGTGQPPRLDGNSGQSLRAAAPR